MILHSFSGDTQVTARAKLLEEELVTYKQKLQAALDIVVRTKCVDANVYSQLMVGSFHRFWTS